MQTNDLKKILISFLSWRVFLFVILFFVLSSHGSLQVSFLGGGFDKFIKNPYLWAWSNFDGDHYINIAYSGYKPLTYFFFPLFPILISIFAPIFGKSIEGFAISGLLVSNISFIAALIGLWKLIILDYDKKITFCTILLLLLFPTSFYFGSVYTESLFLALAIWSFYFARKGKWIFTGLLGFLLTLTRIVGIALIPALIIELWLQKKNYKKMNLSIPIISAILTSLGIVTYMIYLQIAVGDPLAFFHNVNIFGQQRSSAIVLLPQVFYRYIFKILPNISYIYYPVVISTYMEFFSGLFFLVMSLLAIFKIRLSYAIYAICAYLIPPLSGSFSSFPRYALVIFPVFILSSIYFLRLNIFWKSIIILILLVSFIASTSLYLEGYWIS